MGRSPQTDGMGPQGGRSGARGRARGAKAQGRWRRPGRLSVLFFVFASMAVALFARVAYLQILQGDYYAAKAYSQQNPGVDIEPKRGDMVDRNGEAIAVSVPVYMVFISPNEIRDSVLAKNERVADALAKEASGEGKPLGGEGSPLSAIAEKLAALKRGGAGGPTPTPEPLFPDGAQGADTPGDGAQPGGSAELGDGAQGGGSAAALSPTSLDAVAEGLAEALGLSAQDIRARLDKQSMYEVLLKKADAGQGEAAKEFMRGIGLSGLYVREGSKRYYRYGSLASHVIGFVGDDNQGLAGLELTMEKTIQGTPGKMLGEVDARKAALPLAQGGGSIEAHDGYSLVLSLDISIQQIATQALRGAIKDNDVRNGGVAIVMDPRNADVLALVSLPDFDLNDPFAAPAGYPEESWNGRSKEGADILGRTAWRNKAIMDTYEPGSTFKAFTASAGLEDGAITLDSVFYCEPVKAPGYPEPIKCWSARSHGSQVLTQAVCNSCNPAFMRMSQSIGIERFYKYMRDFGFYDKTGIGLPGEAVGNFHEKPKAVDMLVASFGQRFTVTPMEMITAYCAVANGGNLMRPRLVKELLDSEGNVVEKFEPEVVRKVVSKETSDIMRGILEEVVNDGTGKNAYVSGYRVAGKTGTSETTVSGRYIASFVAFAPADDPVVCVFVMLDDPKGDSHMGGAVAAPVARKIVEDTLVYLEVERRYSERDQKQMIKQVDTPNLCGMPVGDAVRALKEAGFGYKLQAGIDDMSHAVVRQRPPAGTKVTSGATVMLYTSAQAEPTFVGMPDLTGMTVSKAIEAMGAAGLNVKASGAGTASSQGADPGEMVEAGSVVDVSFRYMDDIE